MESFVYNALPARVVFGSGTIKKLPEELKLLGSNRPLVITTPGHKSWGEDLLKVLQVDFDAFQYSNAVMHVPENVTLDALSFAQSKNIDSFVAMGGGSTVGLAKALAIRTGLPQIAVPTTYSGSEATPISGETKDGVKTTRKDIKVLPKTIIYDVDFTLGLPKHLTVTSVINALAHAIEALYSTEINPITEIVSIEGIKAVSQALPIIVADPNNMEGRRKALYGAWLCGSVLASVSMALHHKLCHTLGGSFNMPHSQTHTVILPHAIEYNTPGAPEAINKARDALGLSKDVSLAAGVYDLIKNSDGPVSLKELGLEESALEKAASIASKAPYPNPVPLEEQKLYSLFKNAYDGKRPN